MNQAGIPLIWCVVQVTLIGLVTGMMYAAVRRIRPAAALPVVLAGLAAVVVLTTLAFSPWPRWSLLSDPERGPAAISSPLDTSPRTTATPDNAPSPLPAGGQAQSPIGGGAGRVSYWGIVLEGLSRPEVPEVSSGWNWSAAVTAVFLSAAGLAMLWYVMGTMAVRGYRRRSRPIGDPTLREQTDLLRAELGCRCPVELRQTDELVTAATIGWRRPVILLPVGWRDWTTAPRRAVLAHELAHIRAADYLAMTLGQFGLVLHFYHPLVHWLLTRLRLEQELAADAAAASVSGGQREYLKAIAELALRQPHRPMAWPARSFLPTRTTFLRRISMLRDSKLNVEKVSPAARALPICMILAFGVLIAGLRGPAVDRPALAGPADQSPPAANKGAEQPPVEDGFDLSYVPKDAWMLFAVRPAAIFDRPEFEEIGDLLGGPGGPAQVRDLPLEDLEQVTWVAPEPLETTLGARPAPMEMTTLIMQARRAHDFATFLDRMLGDTVAREFKGRTYHVGARGSTKAGYFRPDERTVILAPEGRMKTVISGLSHGVPEFVNVDTWREFQGDHLLVAARSTGLENLVNSPEFQRNAAAFSPLAPLWESTSSVVLGIGLDDRLRVHGAAFSDDRGETKQVKQTLDALVVLSRNAADKGREALGESKSEETEFLLLMLDTGAKLLDELQIERQGNAVRLTTSAEIGFVGRGPFLQAIQRARLAARRSLSANNLKRIALAMHNFHDAYKHFPAAAGRTSKTRRPTEDNPPHSWRVAILPFVEQQKLYEQYRFDEPWDSPENLKVLEKMPAFYRHPTAPPETTDTCYFALVGPETVFSGEEGTPIREIRDGMSNTLMIVEAKRAVPWTKPEDIPYNPEKPIPELGGYFEGGFNAAYCDGSVRFMADSIDEKPLRGLISKSGGEPSVKVPR